MFYRMPLKLYFMKYFERNISYDISCVKCVIFLTFIEVKIRTCYFEKKKCE